MCPSFQCWIYDTHDSKPDVYDKELIFAANYNVFADHVQDSMLIEPIAFHAYTEW